MLGTILFFAVLVILIPGTGFFLSLAFFPKKELDKIERIVFSFLLGIIFPALLLLVENQVFGIPIDFFSATATIAALLIAGAFFYYLKIKKKSGK